VCGNNLKSLMLKSHPTSFGNELNQCQEENQELKLEVLFLYYLLLEQWFPTNFGPPCLGISKILSPPPLSSF